MAQKQWQCSLSCCCVSETFWGIYATGVRVCTPSKCAPDACPLRLCCAMSAEDPSNDNERQVTYTD